MMKEFSRYNLSKPYICYKTTYKVVLNHIYVLDCDIENESCHISFSARDLINCVHNFEGYIDCLFDLHIISEKDYDSFYYFCKSIKDECYPLLVF